jgi:hypothetical protein
MDQEATGEMKITMRLKTPDGICALIICNPLCRRRSRGGGFYRRPSEWIAQTSNSNITGWGRTRREAMADLATMTGGHVYTRSE